MFDLDRFKRAQESGHAGFADAVAELRAGRKTGHWIWYVFPQLASLGRSPMAVRFGVAGAEEAAAYLGDPVLVARLIAAASAVRDHLAPDRGRPLGVAELMGSRTDALKLVSCMTLFQRVAARLQGEAPRAELATLLGHAEAILAAAAAEGYERCAVTDEQLGPPGPRGDD